MQLPRPSWKNTLGHLGSNSQKPRSEKRRRRTRTLAFQPLEPRQLLSTVSVSVSDGTCSEAGPDSGAFWLSLDQSSTESLTVYYSMSGTATNGTDYTTLPGSITIPSGSSGTSVTVSPVDDALTEGDESVDLSLSSNSQYTVGSSSTASLTIEDNDGSLPTVSVSVDDGTCSEAGPDSGSFLVSRTGSTDDSLTVYYSMTGTATNGTDYTTLASSVTIPSGNSSTSVTVSPVDDAIYEGDESVDLNLSTNSQYVVATSSSSAWASLTIQDNDTMPTVSVSVDDGTCSETGPDSGSFLVSRTGSTDASLTVYYYMAGTASNGTDYTTLPGSVTIPSGNSSTSVTVSPVDDAVTEGDESVQLDLASGNSNYTLDGSSYYASLTITDNDGTLPTVSVSVDDGTSSETGPDSGSFLVSRTGSTDESLVVYYSMSGTATNGTDYTTLPGSVTIPVGNASTSVTVAPVDDAITEGDESAQLDLSTNAQYTISGSNPNASLTIDDDDRLAPAYNAPAEGAEISFTGVNFGNGNVQLAAGDLSSLVRTYGNSATEPQDLGNGYGWQVGNWPYLVQTETQMIVVFGASSAFWFTESGGDYTASFGARQTLAYDSTNDVFRFVDLDGTLIEFDDFSQTGDRKGMFRRVTTPGGDMAQVTSWLTAGGEITEIQYRTPGSVPHESRQFSYVSTGANAGRLESILVRRNSSTPTASWTNVSKVEYAYYETDVSESNGLTGDLKTATLYAHDGTTWVSQGCHYYRYYIDSSGAGFAHGMKMALTPQRYANADDDLASPLTATDTALKPYSGRFYEYNSDYQATKAVVDGLYEYTYAYTEGTASDGYNEWKWKVVETAPDDSTYTTYSNYLGQMLLRDLEATEGENENHWYTYQEYGESSHNAGRLVTQSLPSAVSAYTATSSDLSVTQRESDGLLREYVYYSSTTATSSTAGGVSGYVQYVQLKNGDNDATPATLAEYEYFTRTVGTGVSEMTINPVAEVTLYENDDQTGGITTTNAYTWYTDTLQVRQLTTTLPAASTGENGSGTSATLSTYFDSSGRVTWQEDTLGRMTYYDYDDVTGLLVQSVADVDSGQGLTPPTGWTLPTDGQHLVADYEYDDVNGLTQILGAEHDVDGTDVRTAMWIVNLDEDREIRTASGYATESTPGSGTWDTFTLANPVGIMLYDRDGRVTDQIQATRGSGVTDSGKLAPSDTFATSSYTAQATYEYDDAGQLTLIKNYSDIADSKCAMTEYCYNDMGRVSGTKDSSENITRWVYDARGLTTSVWLGTDDEPTSGDWSPSNTTGTNLVKLTSMEYDDGDDLGDGNLTELTRHVDDQSANDRVTSYLYDWRDRMEYAIGPADDSDRITYTMAHYDNLGRVVKTQGYYDDDDDLATAGPETYTNGAAAEDELLSQATIGYNSLGAVYQTSVFAVGQVDDQGTTYIRPGDSLTADFWYDDGGRLLKSQQSGTEEFSKYAYDSLGRMTTWYTGYDTAAGESNYASADDVTGDTIFVQGEYTYDEAGQLIQSTTRQRLHDDTSTTGALGASARVSTAGYWYDEIGRRTDVANYGTGTLNRSTQTSAPTRSDTVLVSSTEYDAAGRVQSTFDPNNRETRYGYYDSGQMNQVIQNYVDGSATTGNQDEDVITDYVLIGQRLLNTTTVTSMQADGVGTDVQTTKYVYGTTVGDASPEVYRNDVVRAVIYSDSDDTFDTETSTLADGTDSTYDRVEYTINRLGQVTEVKDQAGTTHAYDYDDLGRRTSDRATALGTGIDDAVRRVDTAYNVRGLVESITTYDDPDAGEGNAVNQNFYTYTDFNLLQRDYQEHEGAKDANTLYVEYDYAAASDGYRLESIAYPSGRLVHYTYGTAGSTDDNLNRLATIADDNSGSPGDTLAAYSYLGRGTIVIEDYAEPEVKLDYFGGTSGSYAGFDSFGRVVDQLWTDYGADPDAAIDEYTYGYDRVSNRLWKENVVAGELGTPVHLDELYAYDELYRLVGTERGNLNGTADGIVSGTENFEQAWDLDGLGNWAEFDSDDDGDGTWDLEQDREVNTSGEITGVTEEQGQTAWVTPAYDAAGNMTTIPLPSDPTVAQTAVYDAWNRLVEVKQATDTVAVYEYDGLGRRVVRGVDTASPGNPDGTLDTFEHFLYGGVNVVETRDAAAADAQAENLQPHYQYVWSDRYVDSPVLRDENTDADDTCDDGRVYYLTDALGNVTTLIDSTGAVLERYVYDPYGSVTIYNADWSDTRTASSYENTRLYTGREFDPTTGLYYYRARWYDTGTGNFTTRDPLGFAAGDANLYRYVGNRPVGSTDPSGLWQVDGSGGNSREWSAGSVLREMEERDKRTFAAPEFQNPLFYRSFSPEIDDMIRNFGSEPADTSGSVLSIPPPGPRETIPRSDMGIGSPRQPPNIDLNIDPNIEGGAKYGDDVVGGILDAGKDWIMPQIQPWGKPAWEAGTSHVETAYRRGAFDKWWRFFNVVNPKQFKGAYVGAFGGFHVPSLPPARAPKPNPVNSLDWDLGFGTLERNQTFYIDRNSLWRILGSQGELRITGDIGPFATEEYDRFRGKEPEPFQFKESEWKERDRVLELILEFTRPQELKFWERPR